MTTTTSNNIKNYLSSISSKITESKIYNSIHYFTHSGMHIRFADHISPRSENVEINIIKLGDRYILQMGASQLLVEEISVLEQLKSLVSTYQLIMPTVKTFQDAAKTLEKERIQLNQKLVRQQTEINELKFRLESTSDEFQSREIEVLKRKLQSAEDILRNIAKSVSKKI